MVTVLLSRDERVTASQLAEATCTILVITKSVSVYRALTFLLNDTYRTK
jgi:hypothetical protein